MCSLPFVKDWKKGVHISNSAPKYEPECPLSQTFDHTKFPLQASLMQQQECYLKQVHFRFFTSNHQTIMLDFWLLYQVIRLEKIAGEEGWKKWKVTLPQSFRMQWVDDIIFSQEWRELISDFDQKPLVINKISYTLYENLL